MMNRILLSISILLIFLLGYAMITARKMNVIPYEIVTIKTHHTLIQHEDTKWQIPIYLSRQDHALAYQEAYADLYISNSNESRKMWLDLESLHYQGRSSDGISDYHAYHLWVNIPFLGMDYNLDDCHLTIILHNGERFTVAIGSFSYLYLDAANSDDSIDIIGLSGTKSGDESVSYLNTIQLTIENKSLAYVQITAINLGTKVSSDFSPINLMPQSTTELTLTLHIAPFYYTPRVPIIIYYQIDNETYVKTMESFLFYQHTHPLNQNKAVIARYELD